MHLIKFYLCLFFYLMCLSLSGSQEHSLLSNQKVDGYRGIWFTLGQMSQYGDKYSGGLGTYTADHIPIAIYSAKVNKTFFVYGGASPDGKHLLIMASYYDHAKGVVPKPTLVFDKAMTNDPHDNGSISIDRKGYIWVFISGRANNRPGYKYRSAVPYSIERFSRITTQEMTYPQPWYWPGKGFLHLFTKYTKGRELYWESSPDGFSWSSTRKLAGFGGHYLVSNLKSNKLMAVFNWHPGGIVDKRTNLYYLETKDFGSTWQTIRGETVDTPLAAVDNPAMIRDYQKEKKLIYIHDLQFDKNQRPAILYTVSTSHMPGPLSERGPRIWMIAHWSGTEWNYYTVTSSDHNYDTGALYIEPDGTWRIIGPTNPGPQPLGTGGEMVLWTSKDEGKTWNFIREITHDSQRNHSYARRPLNAHPEFYAFWADGNPDKFSESRLYFSNHNGTRVYMLPVRMHEDFEKPVLIKH